MDQALRELTERIIGCAYEVSNGLGAGFLESVYEAALALELEHGGLKLERQKEFVVQYKSKTVGRYYADLVINDQVVVELKALSGLTGEHEAQLLNYLKASGLKLGLLLNFGRPKVEVKRLVWNF